MNKFDYKGIDLHALQVLKLIYGTGNLSTVAQQLDCNQSTVSYTLERLRQAFNDPLFVRSGRCVKPTSRCKELMPQLEQVLGQIHGLFQSPAFNPAEANMRVTISCNQYELAVIAPELIKRLRRLAPGLELQFIFSQLDGHKQLQQGLCDLLISPVSAESEGLYAHPLLADPYVCVMANKHPLANHPLSLTGYLRAQHATVTYDGGWQPFYLTAPELQGQNLNVPLRLPSSSDLFLAIEDTDLLLTVPQRLADTFRGDCHICATPFNAKVKLNLYWNLMTHQAPAFEWLRRQIIAVCSDNT